MKLMESIRKCMGWFLRLGRKTNKTTAAAFKTNGCDLRIEDLGRVLTPQEGMSAGTARFIVERFCGEKMENVEVRHLEDRGRYFKVRLTDPGGCISRELLVDKQSGQVIYSQAVPRIHDRKKAAAVMRRRAEQGAERDPDD